MTCQPCPKCGSRLVMTGYRKGTTITKGLPGMGWVVGCRECGTQTHARANPGLAYDEWNKMERTATVVPEMPGATCRTMY